MKRAYSDAFEPPAPVIPVRIRAPDAPDVVALDGKIDTGADMCAIPNRLVAELGLPPVRTVRATGFAGALHEAIVYRIDVEIDRACFRRLEALTTLRPYVIIGRNVLARCVLRLDGPRARLDLKLPGAR